MTEIYLVKTGGTDIGTVYQISNINNFSWSVETPVTPMPLPEDSHEENILVKMEGNTAKIDVSWTMSEGAYFGELNNSNVFVPDNNLTALEQINEFKTFAPISIGDSFEIRIIDQDAPSKVVLTDKGTINNISFSVSGGSPIVWNVNCSFYVGAVVASLEADIPSSPTSVVISNSSSVTGFDFVVTPYDGYATEPTAGTASEVTGVRLKYKVKGGTWVYETILASASNLSKNSTTAKWEGNKTVTAGKYTVNIAEVNGYSEDANLYSYKRGATSTTSTVTVT